MSNIVNNYMRMSDFHPSCSHFSIAAPDDAIFFPGTSIRFKDRAIINDLCRDPQAKDGVNKESNMVGQEENGKYHILNCEP